MGVGVERLLLLVLGTLMGCGVTEGEARDLDDDEAAAAMAAWAAAAFCCCWAAAAALAAAIASIWISSRLRLAMFMLNAWFALLLARMNGGVDLGNTEIETSRSQR